MNKYNAAKVEKKWQEIWEKKKLYQTDFKKKGKKKYYNLVMFPYPSGDKLHVGHWYNFGPADTWGRYIRMKGYNVFEPIGYDAFGLPAENYAIKKKLHPAKSTSENVAYMRKQLKRMGAMYDWSKEINSSLPDYYKWTQWLFLKMYKKGLAYRAKAPVNYCPKCRTVLANEQVIDGLCERCDSEVKPKELKQWFFKITDYAEKLLNFEGLDWPEKTMTMQKNWIGKKYGYVQYYKVKDMDIKLESFTTHHHTSFAEIFMAIAPEHSLAIKFVEGTKYEAGAKKFIEKIKRKKEGETYSHDSAKDGYFTGRYAWEYCTKKWIPIYIADFALMEFGTGIVKASGHDERDFAFANTHGIEIVEVLFPNKTVEKGKSKGRIEYKVVHPGLTAEQMADYTYEGSYHEKEIGTASLAVKGKVAEIQVKVKEGVDQEDLQESAVIRQLVWRTFYEMGAEKVMVKDGEKELNLDENDFAEMGFKEVKGGYEVKKGQEKPANCYDGQGYMFRSDRFNGMSVPKARVEMGKWMVKKKTARREKIYRLRDWLISRQRYWGAPIPIVYCEKCGEVPVPEKELPVVLPERVDYLPSGKRSPLATSPKFVKCKCPKCKGSAEREVDTMDTFVCSSWYFLRYPSAHNKKAAFEPKVTKKWLPVDMYIGGPEHACMHLLYARFVVKVLHDLGYLTFEEPFKKLVHQGFITKNSAKMSKSKGNVVSPDEFVNKYGSDVFRMYLMFMGPFTEGADWNDRGITGIARFVEKFYGVMKGKSATKDSPEVTAALHRTIKKITGDMERLQFNTILAALMEFLNLVGRDGSANGSYSGQVGTRSVTLRQAQDDRGGLSLASKKILARLIAPLAPHLAEEMWEMLSDPAKRGSIFDQKWPEHNPKLIQEQKTTIVVQVNGKVRGKMEVATDMEEKEVLKVARELSNVKTHLEGKKVVKEIYVKGKLVSLVVR